MSTLQSQACLLGPAHIESPIDQFSQAARVLWVKADVGQWRVGMVIVQIRHRILLDRLVLNGLHQPRQMLIERRGGPLPTSLLGVRVEADDVHLANFPLLELLCKDVQHARGLAGNGVVFVLVLVHLDDHGAEVAVHCIVHVSQTVLAAEVEGGLALKRYPIAR